jgi:hypothetical protein
VTPDEFATAAREYCQTLGGSVTSWGRTPQHSIAVGGFADDPHTRWTGADVVYDTLPPLAQATAVAARLGLQVIREPSHDHLQDHK